MSDDESRDGGVLSGLPRTRPQRRSDRRAGAAKATNTPEAKKTAATKAEAKRATAKKPKAAAAKPRAPAAKPKPKTAAAKPKPKPTATRARRRPAPLDQPRQPLGSPPPPEPGTAERRADRGPAGVLGTAAQAAGELGSIGVTIGKQLVKGALDRLPKP